MKYDFLDPFKAINGGGMSFVTTEVMKKALADSDDGKLVVIDVGRSYRPPAFRSPHHCDSNTRNDRSK